MKRTTAATIVLMASTLPAAADGYAPVTERAEFLALLGGKNLSNRLYGVELAVTPDGKIAGKGAAWEITGSWSWDAGYFWVRGIVRRSSCAS